VENKKGLNSKKQQNQMKILNKQYLQTVYQTGLIWLWTDIQVTVVRHSIEEVVVKGPQMEAKINPQKHIQ
jgi:hypothetical protein